MHKDDALEDTQLVDSINEKLDAFKEKIEMMLIALQKTSDQTNK